MQSPETLESGTPSSSERGSRSQFAHASGVLVFLICLMIPGLIVLHYTGYIPFWLMVLGVFAGPGLVGLSVWSIRTLPTWIQGSARGVDLTPARLLAMRRRGLEPGIIVDTVIRLREGGIEASPNLLADFALADGDVRELADRLPTLDRIERTWSLDDIVGMQQAGFDVNDAIDTMQAAHQRGERLSFVEACEGQLDGSVVPG